MVTTLILAGCQSDDESPDPVTNAPVANAGDDRQAEIGTVVKLDASGSSDPQNDPLTYNWSLVDKPAGSTAVIVGVGKEQAEFTLDKAGIYSVALKVSDGILEATDEFVVTNRTPIINSVGTSTAGGFADDLADVGRTISISGDFFSGDVNENIVTLGGAVCRIEDLNHSMFGEDFIRMVVPEEALSGKLVIKVGEEAVTWPIDIKILSRPVDHFVSIIPLEEQERERNADYKEIGTLIRPLVNGSLVGFSARTPERTDVRITVWDVATKTELAFEKLETDRERRVNKSLDTRVPLEAGKEYLVTINSNNWYFHISNPRTPIYPQTLGNFEILGSLAGGSTTELPTEFTYPETQMIGDYIVLGADMVFAADPVQ